MSGCDDEKATTWEEETTQREVDAALAPAGRRLLLTIIYHPDFARLGETAALFSPGRSGLHPVGRPGGTGRGRAGGTGRVAALSRCEPLFRASGGGGGGADAAAPLPLADRYLSRQPLALALSGGGAELQLGRGDYSVRINGELVRERRLISGDELERGAVLTLARRIVLLLHWGEPPDESAADDCGLKGGGAAIRQARRELRQAAAAPVPVLLLGESGTGKELAARAIHRLSSRADRPLVSLNMAAIPAELASAELFGVSRGAFTGAVADRQGYFRRADGGTLFLDEIGACPPAVQPLLLRALQEGELQVPGGGSVKVDARAIAATDADVGDAGQFSRALRYRLGGYEILMPPLRERREDIGILARHFLSEFYGSGAAAAGKSAAISASPGDADASPAGPGASPAPRAASLAEADAGNSPAESAAAAARWARLFEAFALYDWPGNVRELANYCRQLALDSAGPDGPLAADQLLLALAARRVSAEPATLAPAAAANANAPAPAAPAASANANAPAPAANANASAPTPAATPGADGIPPGSPAAPPLREADIREALLRARWEVSRAAKQLAISRQALYRRIREIPDLRVAADLPGAEVAAAHRACGGELAAAAARLRVSTAALGRRWRAMDLAISDY